MVNIVKLLHNNSINSSWFHIQQLDALYADMQNSLAKDPTSKFVVFSKHPEALSCVRRVLDIFGIQYVTISGTVAVHDRQDAVHKFMSDPECKVYYGQSCTNGYAILLYLGLNSVCTVLYNIAISLYLGCIV